MEKKGKTPCRVKPLNNETSQALEETLPKKNFCRKTGLWECDYDYISFLRRSQESLGLEFAVEEIEECVFF